MATDSASSTTHRRDAERPEGGAGIGGEEGEMKRIARDVGPGEKPGRQEEDQSQQETGMEKNVASQEEEREQQELGLEAAGQKKGLRFWLIFISLLLATFEAALEQTYASSFRLHGPGCGIDFFLLLICLFPLAILFLSRHLTAPSPPPSPPSLKTWASSSRAGSRMLL